MEIIGFLAAIIGLIAAVLNRKKIVVHMTAAEAYSVGRAAGGRRRSATILKRFKRACIALVIGVACLFGAVYFDPKGTGSASVVLAMLFFAGFAVAAYQLLALFLMILIRLWR